MESAPGRRRLTTKSATFSSCLAGAEAPHERVDAKQELDAGSPLQAHYRPPPIVSPPGPREPSNQIPVGYNPLLDSGSFEMPQPEPKAGPIQPPPPVATPDRRALDAPPPRPRQPSTEGAAARPLRPGPNERDGRNHPQSNPPTTSRAWICARFSVAQVWSTWRRLPTWRATSVRSSARVVAGVMDVLRSRQTDQGRVQNPGNEIQSR